LESLASTVAAILTFTNCSRSHHYQLLSSSPTALTIINCSLHLQLLSPSPTALTVSNCSHHHRLLSLHILLFITLYQTASNKMSFNECPPEIRNNIYNYLHGDSLTVLRNTNKKVWQESSTHVLFETRSHQTWFRFNNNKFCKIHQSGAIALIPESIQETTARLDIFYSSPFTLVKDVKAADPAPELPYDIRLTRHVKRLYIEDACLSRLALSEDLIHNENMPNEYIYLLPKHIKFLQIAFPRLETLRCCCHEISIHYGECDGVELKLHATDPLKDDQKIDIPPARGPLATFYAWKANFDYALLHYGSLNDGERQRSIDCFRKAGNAKKTLEALCPPGLFLFPKLRPFSQQLISDLQDYCTMLPKTGNTRLGQQEDIILSTHPNWPSYIALENLVRDGYFRAFGGTRQQPCLQRTIGDWCEPYGLRYTDKAYHWEVIVEKAEFQWRPLGLPRPGNVSHDLRAVCMHPEPKYQASKGPNA
jgi:hypothetical protein